VQKIPFILLLFFSLIAFPQGDISVNSTYPTNYFRKPLDIPIVLSGTFGELRTNHFHAGLDIKTQQAEGLNVYSAAQGYVSRIKISHWGYGKALYVTHPNGYTSVYAHLKKFNNRIETYIKKQQYKKESFEVHVFPTSTELPVSKDEIIAFSGSTGGFVAPHLHFEIRNTETEKPINPLFFGIEVNDSKKPRINTLVAYALDGSSHINQLNIPTQLTFKRLKNGNFLAHKITAHGTIGFGINAYDQLDGAHNKNGLYSLEMLINGEKVHEFVANTFSFAESKYINLLIDYARFAKMNQRIQKCFVEPSNKLSLYNKTASNGYITINDGLDYTVDIIAKDYQGNMQKISIPIVGKEGPILVEKTRRTTPYKIDHTQFNEFNKEGIKIAFPKYTFYNDFYLDFSVKDSIVKVHEPIIPLHKNYTLTFDVSKYTSDQKKQLYIASINKNGKTSYAKTIKKDSVFFTSTKKLGDFTLLTDNQTPNISLHNFKDEQWLSNFNSIKVKISDKESGIKSYRGEIDGAWILMEYDVKKGLLTYNLNDKKFAKAKHELNVSVIDNVGNSKTVSATFYRKK
jgi:murein DD-endopeptidase MepM/ murein hydrolase activator NlpD